jgi:antitoxin VapB
MDQLTTERRVRLFRIGGNQAVRIPRGFELAGEKAVLRKEGGRLVLEAAPQPRLLQVLAQLSPLDEELKPIADPAPRTVEF